MTRLIFYKTKVAAFNCCKGSNVTGRRALDLALRCFTKEPQNLLADRRAGEKLQIDMLDLFLTLEFIEQLRKLANNGKAYDAARMKTEIYRAIHLAETNVNARTALQLNIFNF